MEHGSVNAAYYEVASFFFFFFNREGFCPSQREKVAQKTSKNVPGGK